MVTYKTGNLSNLNFQERQKLAVLSLRARGMMAGDALKKDQAPIVVAYIDDEPVGWTIIMQNRHISKNRWVAYAGVYVSPLYRKMGIGKTLLEKIGDEIKDMFDFLVVMPHDENSQAFFKKIGTKQWMGNPPDKYSDDYPRRVKPLKETVDILSNVGYNNGIMTDIKELIVEGVREKALEDFIKTVIRGTEWQGKVFIAGGYVRDEFMGKDPKDLDLLVNAPNGGIEFAKWLTKKVGAYKGGANEEDPGSNPVIFQRFGTAKFNLHGVVHNGIDLSEMDVEAVMPRKEQYTVGSRKPEVTGGDLKDDVERRDFTVNSLLKDLSSGEVLDLTGLGKADIQAGIVRTPLNPDKIFTDDPLRMLRAIRFAVKYNWKLPMFMVRGLKKNAAQLKNISQERVRDELNKMLVTGTPGKAIKLLKVTNLLQFVIPELIPAIKMTQNVHHKADVFQHTLDVLGKTQPILVQRLMGLFHDIGKTVTRTVEPDTQGVHFYGHEMAGEEMVETVMSRLKYPRELIDVVKLGVRNHMRLKQAGDTGIRIKDKILLKFRNEMGEQLENVLNLMHADNIAHAEASSMPHQIAGIRQRLEKLKDVPTKPKMPITGNDLQQTLGLKPGPLFKEIMNVVAEAWYENPGLNKEQALEIARKVAKL